MDLSLLIGGGVRPYLEFGWVCAPNAATQTIPQSTVTTLSCNTKIADTGSFGAILSSTNQFSLSAGTYYFEAQVPCSSSTEERFVVTTSLYNATDATYITRCQVPTVVTGFGFSYPLKGQFTISSPKTFQLQINANSRTGTVIVGAYSIYSSFANSGANDDQRTTIKLWKLA